LGKQEHSSTVKGVAFDPAGKYIASSGDDPAIIIWRAFDDWGLEAKIDSSNGIFRTTSKQNSGGGSRGEEDEQVDVQALANLSLFRRISFAPDGTHICGTNATLRGKNIAAMIGREGWGVSTSRSGGGSGGAKNMNAQGAANLVGHSQPVVSSRHCPFFFDAKKKKSTLNEKGIAPIENGEDDDEAAEPKYSTIVALGDKKGFVTIWSTRKTRPIFKLQCSESRCTGMWHSDTFNVLVSRSTTFLTLVSLHSHRYCLGTHSLVRSIFTITRNGDFSPRWVYCCPQIRR
jgi:protein HIRA/HIR1